GASSIGITQLAPLRPKLPRLENSRWRDDARDQIRRGHVKSRVPRTTRRIGHANVNPSIQLRIADCGLRICYCAPCAEDFAFVPFLNRDVEAAVQIPVNR